MDPTLRPLKINAYLLLRPSVVVNGVRGFLALLMLLAAAHAFRVDLSAPGEVEANADWEIRAFVVNDSVNESYPDCTLALYLDGESQGGYGMDAASGYAHLTLTFGEAGSYSATVYCTVGADTNSSSLGFHVTPNSQLDVDLSGGDYVGDTLDVEADYEDLAGDDITSGTCSASIYADGDYVQSRSLYYDSGRSAYYAGISVGTSGDHTVEATCSASGYTDASDSGTFEATSLPVTIQPSTTSVSGSYGESRSVSLTVSPSTATCDADYGAISKVASNRWTLRVRLNFLGRKDVRVTCSAPQRTTGVKSIRFTSREQPTRLSLSFSTKTPHSFQSFRVSPQYYDTGWNPVYGASCTLTLNGQSRPVDSFQQATFEAPAGPAEAVMSVSCSKTGYEAFEGSTTFQVNPIPVEGELRFPPNAKKEEPVNVRVLLDPAVNADCTLEGELTSLEGVSLTEYRQDLDLGRDGAFTLTSDESGRLAFEVNCSLAGYTPFEESGEMSVTTFSRTEEMQATILLTTLTIMLAVGFMLVRRWL